jgi:hypothetical protein
MANKKYILTKQYISKDTLNRLVKQIIDTSKQDRQQALDLFADVQSRLGSAESNLVYADLVKTAIPILKQVQDVNNTLLKTMDLIQSFLAKSGVAKKAGSDPIDLFEGLSKLTRVEDGKEDNE